MLTRRLGLLASALSFGGRPGLAQSKHAAAADRTAAGGHKGKDAPRPTGSPADTPLGPVDTAARWAYIEDFDTGATLLEKQADDEMPPSSMTKLMTMYLVYDQLKQGRLKLDDELPVVREGLADAGLENVRAARQLGEGGGPDPRRRSCNPATTPPSCWPKRSAGRRSSSPKR